MPRAILRDGVIYPVEPLPPDWTDGMELWVDEAREETPEEIDRRFKELEEIASQMSEEDDRKLQTTLAEARRLAKPCPHKLTESANGGIPPGHQPPR